MNLVLKILDTGDWQ